MSLVADTIPVRVYYQASMPLRFKGRTYRRGDCLVLTVRGEVATGQDPDALLEWLWVRLNADDRPWGDRLRSMSMGDVVVIGNLAYSCETLGWARAVLAPEDCHDAPPFAPLHLGLLIPDILRRT